MNEQIAIRKIIPEDAEIYLRLLNHLDEETEFRAYEPGERKSSVEEMKNLLVSKNEDLLLLAEFDDEPAGYFEAERGKFNRNKHSAHINLAVLIKHQGKGIGKMFFEEAEKWAKLNNIRRLDLCVFTYNKNAVNLYRKMGYEIEGTKKDSFFVNGKYVDEYIMAKLL